MGITSHLLVTPEGRILAWCILVNRPCSCSKTGSPFFVIILAEMQVVADSGASDIGQQAAVPQLKEESWCGGFVSLSATGHADGCMHTRVYIVEY